MDAYEKQLFWDHAAYLKRRIDSPERTVYFLSALTAIALLVAIFVR
ncbi:hypothetical protein N8D56_05140 [Devosia sp. A8/3-2]|nr:hypothetical protein N8D56_05140 [Devosia sp. A8/3-2]